MSSAAVGLLAAIAMLGTGTHATAHQLNAATQPVDRVTVPLEPYVAFSWAPVPESARQVSPLLRFDRTSLPGAIGVEARQLPPGRRVLFSWDLTNALLEDPRDRCLQADLRLSEHQGVWPDWGVASVQRRYAAFWTQFQRAGGHCDMLVLDYEAGWSAWVMTPERLAAIRGDPRFPLLGKRLGFDDIERKALWEHSRATGEYLKWNSVTGSMLNEAINRAVWDPLRQAFPKALLSNYDSLILDRPHVVPDPRGHLQYKEGPCVGNCQSPSIYGEVPSVSVGRPPADWADPMTSVIHGANYARAIMRSSPLPVIPWIAHRSWTGNEGAVRTVPWADTDYWQENVYQVMLSVATNNLLFWNPPDRGLTSPATPQDAVAMHAALLEIQRMANGHPLAEPMTLKPVEYKAKVLVSAARTQDGTILARVTFAPDAEAEQTVEIDGHRYRVTRPAGAHGLWLRFR